MWAQLSQLPTEKSCKGCLHFDPGCKPELSAWLYIYICLQSCSTQQTQGTCMQACLCPLVGFIVNMLALPQNYAVCCAANKVIDAPHAPSLGWHSLLLLLLLKSFRPWGCVCRALWEQGPAGCRRMAGTTALAAPLVQQAEAAPLDSKWLLHQEQCKEAREVPRAAAVFTRVQASSACR